MCNYFELQYYAIEVLLAERAIKLFNNSLIICISAIGQ